MGKWTERLASKPADGACANSAISANSPASGPFGTNGTNGRASPPPCDQVAFDETAGALEYDHRQPRDVAEAVASLFLMPAPEGMTAERWRQLIEDAGIFASTRWAEAQANGWTILEIFGVSPGFVRRIDRDGLVSLLYGREAGEITPDHIIIRDSNGLRFRKGKGAGAVPVWEAALG